MSRPMTNQLADALDALSGFQRNMLKVLAAESEHEWFRALLLGLRAELVADEQREKEILAGLAADPPGEDSGLD